MKRKGSIKISKNNLKNFKGIICIYWSNDIPKRRKKDRKVRFQDTKVSLLAGWQFK